jgi:SOS-response transcriptional repressor LexA
MISEAQSRVLHIIRQHTNRHGFAPTLAELCEYTMTKSTGSMTKHVNALVRGGFIERGFGGWRDIKLKDTCPCCGQKMTQRNN